MAHYFERMVCKSQFFTAFFYICISLCLLSSLNAEQLEEGGKEAEIYEMGEVVVTAEREVQESPTTISEITAKDIERQNAANMGEALKLLPGVHFHQGRAKQGFYANIRGFEQDKVLILLDGIPIYEPYEGLVNLLDIPVQNIAKIKVVKGLPSALYGPNTMGGVINVITKKGSENPSAALQYQIADYNTHHVVASHGWKIGELSYFVGVSHRESDGFNLAETFTLPSDILASMANAPSPIPHEPIAPDSGRRDNSDYERDAITLTGNWDINNDNKLGLSFEYYNNDYGIPPVAIYRETPSAGGTAHYYPRYWRFDDWERYTISLTEESQLSDSFRLKCRVFYDDYKNVLNAYDDSTYSTQDRDRGAPSGRSKYDDYNTGFNLYGFWDGIQNHNIRLGFTFKRDVHEETWQSDPTERLVSHTYSSALEDEIYIQDNLTLTLGASYDIFNKKERRQASGSETGDNVNAFNPQVGISYDPSSSVNLYASAGRKIRFPTMRNLYSSGVIGPQGDPDLNEERTYSYELGGKWFVNTEVTLEGALFYNDVKNLIIFDNQTGRFEQYDDADIYGVELSVLAQLTADLLGRVSYTFLEAENDDSTVTVENNYLPDLVYTPDEIPYTPKHKIDFDLTHSLNFGIKIHVNGSFIYDQIYYDKADLTDNTRFVAKKERLDEYFLLNSKITYDFKKHYQIFLAVDNILNEDYQDLYLSPAPGITAWLGVKIEL